MTYQLTEHTEPNWFFFRRHLWKWREGEKSWEDLKEERKCKLKKCFSNIIWTSPFKSNSWPAWLPTNNPELNSKYFGLPGKSSNCYCPSQRIFYSAKELVIASAFIALLHRQSGSTPQSTLTPHDLVLALRWPDPLFCISPQTVSALRLHKPLKFPVKPIKRTASPVTH